LIILTENCKKPFLPAISFIFCFIAVLTTNPTTVEPTRQTLAVLGLESGQVAIHVIAEAFAALQRGGDLKTHDEIVAASVNDHLGGYGRVALAQASMARAIELPTEEQRGRVFSSPELAIQRLASILKGADKMNSPGAPKSGRLSYDWRRAKNGFFSRISLRHEVEDRR